MMRGSLAIEVTGLEEWIRGFDALEDDLAREGAREWQLVADTMFDRSQQYVHVLTGSLKSSGMPPVVTVKDGQIVAEIVYGDGRTVDYAVYEHERGGDHAWLNMAFADTSDEFDNVLATIFEKVVGRWR